MEQHCFNVQWSALSLGIRHQPTFARESTTRDGLQTKFAATAAAVCTNFNCKFPFFAGGVVWPITTSLQRGFPFHWEAFELGLMMRWSCTSLVKFADCCRCMPMNHWRKWGGGEELNNFKHYSVLLVWSADLVKPWNSISQAICCVSYCLPEPQSCRQITLFFSLSLLPFSASLLTSVCSLHFRTHTHRRRFFSACCARAD